METIVEGSGARTREDKLARVHYRAGRGWPRPAEAGLIIANLCDNRAGIPIGLFGTHRRLAHFCATRAVAPRGRIGDR